MQTFFREAEVSGRTEWQGSHTQNAEPPLVARSILVDMEPKVGMLPAIPNLKWNEHINKEKSRRLRTEVYLNYRDR